MIHIMTCGIIWIYNKDSQTRQSLPTQTIHHNHVQATCDIPNLMSEFPRTRKRELVVKTIMIPGLIFRCQKTGQYMTSTLKHPQAIHRIGGLSLLFTPYFSRNTLEGSRWSEDVRSSYKHPVSGRTGF